MNVMVRKLPLDKINPFDSIHVPMEDGGFYCRTKQETMEHWAGIAYCRRLMHQGEMIRPIAVTITGDSYQRLDGFKRYWAHKLEGETSINCYIVDAYVPGCQHGQPMTLEGE